MRHGSASDASALEPHDFPALPNLPVTDELLNILYCRTLMHVNINIRPPSRGRSPLAHGTGVRHIANRRVAFRISIAVSRVDVRATPRRSVVREHLSNPTHEKQRAGLPVSVVTLQLEMLV